MKTPKAWQQARSLNCIHADERLRAIEKLATSRDANAVAALIRSLDDSDPEVRASAADALGEQGGRQGVAPLVRLLLREKAHEILEVVVVALDKLDAQKTVQLLLASLDDDDTAVRQNAAWALRRVGWVFLDDAERARALIVQNEWEEVAALGSAAVEPLETALRSGTDHLKRAAAEALGNIDTSKAFRTLAALLSNPDINGATRERAAWALKRFYRDDLTEGQAALVAVVERDWAEAVQLGGSAVEALRTALDDDDHEVRAHVVQALARIGGAEAIDSLVHALCDGRQPVTVRATAAKLLGQLGDDRALSALSAALGAEGWAVREAAAESLAALDWRPTDNLQRARLAIIRKRWREVAALGEAATEPLVDSLQYLSVASDAAKVLAQLGPAGIDALLGVLRDRTQPPVVREVVAASLADMGDARALEAIKGMLDDPDMATRQAAVWTLEKLGWQPADDKQRAVVAVAHDEWEKLGSLGAAAVEPLLTLAAGSMAPHETVTTLCQLLTSSATCLSLKQLRSLVSLTDIAQPSFAGYGGGETLTATSSKPVDCGKVRKLARFELIRRGIMF